MALIGGVLGCLVRFGLSAATLAVVWSALLLVLTVAPLLARYGVESRRAFWCGLAWFGWAYVLLFWAGRVKTEGPLITNSPQVLRLPVLLVEMGTRYVYDGSLPAQSRAWSDDPTSEFGDFSATYDARRYTPGAMAPAPPAAAGGIGGGGGGMALPTAASPPTGRAATRLAIPWELFRDLAHAIWAALFSILGGIIAWRLSTRRVTPA